MAGVDLDAPEHSVCSSILALRDNEIRRLARHNIELIAEVERLREALVKAEDLAAEGVGYTDSYFVQKWRMNERLADIQEALALRSTPAPRPKEST